MNIEKTTIVLVPETGYKRTISVKLTKPVPSKDEVGLFTFHVPGSMVYHVRSKQARFAVMVTDGTGKIAEETKMRVKYYESRVDALKDYCSLTAYYKILAHREENPEEKPTYQNGGWYIGWDYEWPTHPWNK